MKLTTFSVSPVIPAFYTYCTHLALIDPVKITVNKTDINALVALPMSRTTQNIVRSYFSQITPYVGEETNGVTMMLCRLSFADVHNRDITAGYFEDMQFDTLIEVS